MNTLFITIPIILLSIGIILLQFQIGRNYHKLIKMILDDHESQQNLWKTQTKLNDGNLEYFKDINSAIKDIQNIITSIDSRITSSTQKNTNNQI